MASGDAAAADEAVETSDRLTTNALDMDIASIEDERVRRRIAAAFSRLRERAEYGLVFEKHKPESVVLYGQQVREDRYATLRTAPGPKNAFRVVEIDDGMATLQPVDEHFRPAGDRTTEALEALVPLARFGDPIFPGLEQTGEVLGAVDQDGNPTKPFHTVINGENFHALETLLYAYERKVDCIYIDPPYNTGAQDWKYNNDYVDKDDVYRHSLWLSFMEKRLKLAARLLNPADSVLIVTIDEKEYLRLGLLLEQMFQGWKIQMISSVINPRGIVRANEFSRSNEFIFYVWTPGAKIAPASIEASEGIPVAWETMRRRAIEGRRGRKGKGACGPNQFFAIHVDEQTGHIVGRGDCLAPDFDIKRYKAPKGTVAVFPIRDDGTEMNWSLTDKTFDERWANGYVRAGKATPTKPQKYIMQYVLGGVIDDINEGRAVVTGRAANGSVIAEYVSGKTIMAHTHWDIGSHNAQQHGTGLLGAFLPDRKFPYAKSLYAVEDTIRYFVRDKPNALIVDFFSGSGTTAHAVMRLNRQHGGTRRTVLVTNNEVGAAEQEELRAKGLRPGDAEWEELGICEHVTKPRIEAAIRGKTHTGDPVDGEYRFSDPFPMRNGFEENARFYNLTYLDPETIEAKQSFGQIAHLLWLIGGAEGPVIDEETPSGWALPERATYGVLFRNKGRVGFAEALAARTEAGDPPRHVFIVADSTDEFHRSLEEVGADPAHTTRLYRSYLKNFRTNVIDPKDEL